MRRRRRRRRYFITKHKRVNNRFENRSSSSSGHEKKHTCKKHYRNRVVANGGERVQTVYYIGILCTAVCDVTISYASTSRITTRWMYYIAAVPDL